MSEDPFYCGETFEKVEEVIPRDKIWRVKTEEEFRKAHDLDYGMPRGWNAEGMMSFLYGKPLDEIFKVKSNEQSLEEVKKRLTAKKGAAIRSIVGEQYYEVYRSGSRQYWSLSDKDFIFDYPV